MVVVPKQAGQDSTICGITVSPDKEPSGLLHAHPLAAGRYAQIAVRGDWATIEQAATDLCTQTLADLGVTAAGPWFCLFQTNPRSTDPQDWESLICVPTAP
jgi:DNA gyrase inhibitor GyrI